MQVTDTIYALSSGSIPAGIAVVRVSGRGARAAIEALAGGIPKERTASLRSIRNAAGSLIDKAIVLFFSGPDTVTGEDIVEFHLHGGRAVVAAVFAELGSLAGFRIAEPGEFTGRAFINGRLDLLEAEALGDLIEAETEAQRRLAIDNAGGRQSDLYRSWTGRIADARALVEAYLDFADESDVGMEGDPRHWMPDITQLLNEIRRHVGLYRSGEIVREGFQVVIVGPPNAGKSSLLNLLARRDVAIVSAEAGTTRDLIEVALDIDGLKIVVTDTAGIRLASGVEAIGIARAQERAARADLVLSLVGSEQNEADFVEIDAASLRVTTKVDLGLARPGSIGVSTATGAGVEELLAEIGRLALSASPVAETVLPTKTRHVDELGRAVEGLTAALAAMEGELAAEGLRAAGAALSRLGGAIDTEAVLDRVFSRFCIGK